MTTIKKHLEKQIRLDKEKIERLERILRTMPEYKLNMFFNPGTLLKKQYEKLKQKGFDRAILEISSKDELITKEILENI